MADAVRSFRDLGVWQKAMDLVVEVYRDADGFPKSELYGLSSQLRRALVSIPANIAEGRGRRSTRSFLHFLDIAYGSMTEAETLLEIAARLGFLPADRLATHLGRIGEIGRMLSGLIAALEQRLNTPPPPGSGLPSSLNPESGRDSGFGIQDSGKNQNPEPTGRLPFPSSLNPES